MESTLCKDEIRCHIKSGWFVKALWNKTIDCSFFEIIDTGRFIDVATEEIGFLYQRFSLQILMCPLEAF